MWSITPHPLIHKLSKATTRDNAKQVWFADDSSAVGEVKVVKNWCAFLQKKGPKVRKCANAQQCYQTIWAVKSHSCTLVTVQI